ncbi:LXG domain-containing protein [Lacticaseibacillus casei]|uniref:T7SS effector LXG polymorphic toxin n=1 Tax=Lacticaseibacillus casei TaxID=1582 RepID=UPI00237EA430|nr:T7SS effector LXG polymorphic toxin [Lacticaseibacillus casei]MDE3283252.1 LXG domain-containing protein [Lacticaseibacillus casei]
MGFHVDLKEVTEAGKSYQAKAKAVTEQINQSGLALGHVADSKALEGATGRAIGQDIRNIHLPIAMALVDLYRALDLAFQQEQERFAATVKETDTSAVIDEDTLDSLSQRLDQLRQEKDQLDSQTKNIYRDVEDIISLSFPSTSKFDHEANDTHGVLQHTKTWVHEFEAQQGTLDNLHDIESKVQSKLGEAEGIVGNAFSSSKLMSVASSTSFRTYVKQKQGSLEWQVEKMRRMDQQKKWIKGVEQGREFYEDGSVDSWPDLLSAVGQNVLREGGQKTISNGLTTTGKYPGVMVNDSLHTYDVGQGMIKNGQKMAGIGEKVGKWMPGVGFTLGTADDYFSGRRTLGNAVVYNGVVTGIGWGVSSLVAVALGPGIITVGVAIAMAAAVTFAFNKLYKNNVLGIKDRLNEGGKFFDKNIMPILKGAFSPTSHVYI